MKKFIKIIGYYADEIFMGLIVSFCFLAVVTFTAILLSDLPNGFFPLLFSIAIYGLETLFYLTTLVVLFLGY